MHVTIDRAGRMRLAWRHYLTRSAWLVVGISAVAGFVVARSW